MARDRSSPAPAAIVTGMMEIAKIIATLASVLRKNFENARTRPIALRNFSPMDMAWNPKE